MKASSRTCLGKQNQEIHISKTHLSGDKVAKLALAVTKFVKEEEGAALAEYGILVAFIAIVAITAVTFFGTRISAKFTQLANSFS